MIDEAIILASGYGTRLRPLTDHMNKVILPVGGRPFITYVLDMLCNWGIKRVVMKVAYKWQTIYKTLGQKYRNLNISYIVTEMPLGTGGDLQMALHYVRGPQVFVLNGDTLFKIDHNKFYEECKEEPFALALTPSKNGNVSLGKDGRIDKFTIEPSSLPYRNGGIYLVNTEMFELQTTSLEEALANGLPARGYVDCGFFIDIGTPIDYGLAQLYVPKETREWALKL